MIVRQIEVTFVVEPKLRLQGPRTSPGDEWQSVRVGEHVFCEVHVGRRTKVHTGHRFLFAVLIASQSWPTERQITSAATIVEKKGQN